ncbi:MAG: SCO family protein, partial [Gammaproteobacteria bacterium]
RQLGVTEYPQPIVIEDFSLVDQNGQTFASAQLQGKWSLVFFGFTSCSDICPLTTAELSRTLNELPAQQRKLLQVIFVSVDPARDSPEILAQYLDSFHEELIGLTGDIESLAQQLYVVINDTPQPHGDDHHDMSVQAGQIDHSSHLSLIGPEANLRAVLRPPHRSRDIARVLDFFY